MIATNFLMSYVEYAIAEHDIQRGYLAQLLLKPFPYLLYRFFAEIPWRTIRGVIGIITVVMISVIFSGVISIGISVGNILPIIVVSILAYILSFLFKSTASLLNFWLTDFTGFMNLIEIVVLIGAGYLMPIDLMPTKFGTYINSTPFPYMIYYPVRVMMGDYSLSQTFLVIAKQFFWIVLFYILFLLLWNKGLKKFTGVGL